MKTQKKDKIIFSSKDGEVSLDTPCGQPQSCEAIGFYLERITYLERLVKKYKFDSMTGLMGKQDFNDKLDRVFEEHEFTDAQFTFVLIDINNLHNINKIEGMEAGDNLIISVAEQLRKKFSIDQVYRIGGDEFAIIVRDTVKSFKQVKEDLSSLQGASFIAERSKGYIHPRQLIKTVDKKLTKLKAKNPCERI